MRELGAMKNRRSEFSNRRHIAQMPRVPFKDSNGATITKCRRKIPDRRIGYITRVQHGVRSNRDESLGLSGEGAAPSFWRVFFMRK